LGMEEVPCSKVTADSPLGGKLFIPGYDMQGMRMVKWSSSKHLQVLYPNQVNHPIFL